MKPRLRTERQNRIWADAPGDTIARLVAAADDPAFRARLLFVVGLPASHRSSLIPGAIQEMRLKGEDAADRLAFPTLADETTAPRLRSELEGRP